jgi:type IX secretion system PorP/SprF family membrane protein
MKSLIIKSGATVLLAAATFTTGAQQIFKISQYMDRSFIHNPAAAGANGITTIGAMYRTMWSGISGGPKTGILFGDTYFASKNTGMGVVLYTDNTGPTSRTGAEFNLSYSVKLNGADDKRLMMGLGAQVLQFKVDKEKIAQAIAGDPLLSSSGTAIKGDGSAGIYLRTPGLNLGVSVKQLIQPKLNFVKSTTNPEGMLYRHYFFTGSYNIKTDEDNTLIPHFEVRYQPNAPADYEGGVLLDHKDLIRIGFSMHYKQSYTAFAGVKLAHRFSIGYAYDVYNQPLSYFDNGNAGHEIVLRYFFAAL